MQTAIKCVTIQSEDTQETSCVPLLLLYLQITPMMFKQIENV